MIVTEQVGHIFVKCVLVVVAANPSIASGWPKWLNSESEGQRPRRPTMAHLESCSRNEDLGRTQHTKERLKLRHADGGVPGVSELLFSND